MTVHVLTPQLVTRTTGEPRLPPCQARGVGAGSPCGSVPASLWRRHCAHAHSDEVRLCGTHSYLITRGLAQCLECERRGQAGVPIYIVPVQMLLAR